MPTQPPQGYSRQVRAFARMGDLALRLGLVGKPMRLEVFEERAKRVTGFDDFGPEPWRENFQALIDACLQNGQLNFLGSMTLKTELTRVTENRLRIEATIAQSPEILEQSIEKPLIIIGLPRTGSTVLHNLLCLHPEARVPLVWKLMRPAAPLDQRGPDPRREQALRTFEQAKKALPGIETMHAFSVDGPEECLWLYGQSGLTTMHMVTFDVPHYCEHFLRCDHLPAVRYNRRQLQVMQWGLPGEHWVLKSPTHMFRMAELLEVFPDARLVQTHRDPMKVVASLASLTELLRSGQSEPTDPVKLGGEIADLWAEATDRWLALRERVPPEQIYDVHFDALQSDPVGVVQSIYRHFGMPVPEGTRARVQAWLAQQPGHSKVGTHRYAAERYGLDAAGMRRRFGRYMDFVETLRAKDAAVPKALSPGKLLVPL